MILRRTQLHFTLNAGISLKFSVGLLRKKQLRLIFLAKWAKSLLRAALFINVGVGEKPSPFLNTLISKSANTLWLKLNTTSEQKKPLRRPLLSVLVMSSFCVTPIFSSIFLMVSSTVVVLAGALIKPAVDVQIKGGRDTSEMLSLSF